MESNNSSGGFAGLNFQVVLHNFLLMAKRLIWILLLLAIAVGCAVYVSQDKKYVPIYSSSAVFAVNAHYTSTTDITSHSDFMDANAALSLSQTFPYVIQSENTLMLLRQELEKDYINGNISASSTAEVGLFTLSVTSSSPQDAFDILYAVIDVYPQAASNILGETQLKIIKLPLDPPTDPINGNTAASQGFTAGVVVLVALLLLVFFFSLSRKTVHSAEDLRKLVNLKCLAYVPKVRLKKHSNTANQSIIITNRRINPSFNESIRNLRVKLQKSLSRSKSHILLITSTLPNEGKTTVATNLALSLASEGKRVILIDGDLRKQALKEAMGLDQPSDGLVEILSGDARNFRLLNVPNSTLLLLSGDETTDSPQKLLDSPRMQQVLDLLKEKLDYIIIDSPPAGILSDAATIAKYCDEALYIVRQDHANTSQIADSIQSLSAAGVNIIGCVLNQTVAGTTRYGYGSKYSASYGYSYGYKYASGHYGYSSHSASYAAAEAEAEELTEEISRSAQVQELKDMLTFD